MKIGLFLFPFFLSTMVAGQPVIDPSKLPLVPFQPGIAGIDPQNAIPINYLFSKGLTVILADETFRVVQFDLVYDCPSKTLFDFDVRRYQGNCVDAKDEYFRKRIVAGDVMDLVNTVIEKNGVRYRMKDRSFIVR